MHPFTDIAFTISSFMEADEAYQDIAPWCLWLFNTHMSLYLLHASEDKHLSQNTEFEKSKAKVLW